MQFVAVTATFHKTQADFYGCRHQISNIDFHYNALSYFTLATSSQFRLNSTGFAICILNLPENLRPVPMICIAFIRSDQLNKPLETRDSLSQYFSDRKFINNQLQHMSQAKETDQMIPWFCIIVKQYPHHERSSKGKKNIFTVSNAECNT